MATAAKKAPAPATKVAATKRLPSLGAQIDALFHLREKLREIQAKEKEQQELIAAAEVVLMETMEREGVDKSTGKLASVSVSENGIGNVTDWDAFWAFIFKNKYSHLLQRRVSDPAIRELFETKGKVPGVELFMKRKLNLRKT